MSVSSPPPLALVATSDPHWLIAAGEIDMLTAPELAAALESGSYEGVDLRRVSFLDVSGLRVLLNAARSAQAEGRRFAVANPSPMIRRLLSLTAIDQTVDVVFDHRSATSSL
jgi:anti-sigma B factor antagonist